MLQAIIKDNQGQLQHIVLWLHGLGADGSDFAQLLPYLKASKTAGVKWIFPHAPIAAVTINGGAKMRSWFDIKTADLSTASNWQDIKTNCLQIEQQFLADYISSDKVKIHLAGFSQGGVVALQLATELPVASVLALSSFHPLALPKSPACQVCIMHGKYDAVIPMKLGENTYSNIQKKHNAIQWHTYEMGHEVCSEQIATIDQFYNKQLKQQPNS